MLWGWLQERRKVGSYDYAGCLSLPRIMYISGNRLIQVIILCPIGIPAAQGYCQCLWPFEGKNMFALNLT